jgi:hypothetical protein
MSATPQDFDLDAWLDGADRPERSVTVYQRAGLIADLDRLAEQIRNADDDEIDGPSMAGGVGQLRAEYAKVAKQFHDSALTVRVRSVSQSEQSEIRDRNTDLDERALGKLVLSDAFVSPKATPEQVGKLERILGDAQFSLIVGAWQQACRAVPAVSADFLPKRSTQGDGGE